MGYDRDMLDEMLEILVDTVCSTRKQIRIGGQDYPNEVVKSRLLKLDSSHIEYVLDSPHQNTTKVRNIYSIIGAEARPSSVFAPKLMKGEQSINRRILGSGLKRGISQNKQIQLGNTDIILNPWTA